MGFRGCDAIAPEPGIQPQYCKDNVFNVEGTQVTIYHGKVMQLRVTNLIVPSASSIRLSDGHKQDTRWHFYLWKEKRMHPNWQQPVLFEKERRCTSAHTSKMQRPTMLTICYLNCFTKKTTTMNKTIIICLWILFVLYKHAASKNL